MKLLARIAIALVVLVALVFAGGAVLPREHTAAVRVEVAAPPHAVFDAIADVAGSDDVRAPPFHAFWPGSGARACPLTVGSDAFPGGTTRPVPSQPATYGAKNVGAEGTPEPPRAYSVATKRWKEKI